MVGMLEAGKIAQQQATQQLQIDIQCLKQYEVECQKGTVTTETFTNTMGKASASAQSYATNIKNGTGSAQVYANQQKAIQAELKATSTASRVASVGVKTLSVAMNTIALTAIFSIITKGISVAVEKINDYIHRNEIAIVKAEELLSNFKSDIDSISSNQETISGYKEEFKKLSKGVDDLGRNVSLT